MPIFLTGVRTLRTLCVDLRHWHQIIRRNDRHDRRVWKAVVGVSRSLQRVAINLLRVVEIIQLKHLFCYA